MLGNCAKRTWLKVSKIDLVIALNDFEGVWSTERRCNKGRVEGRRTATRRDSISR
ncbi:MAG: hypothetical protein QFX33_02015 [Candidatus Nezhaarchaeota archaeon]|nr:hypothetical protein [Candidatus Nezhaarchaeota archaeon]